ncbi:hypothetical protein [Sulfolobus acidocaldarius]|uniref:Uncharacterized protein n=3 Tax=Sulfolobus acidocaldarius TaxID=2285 RepID=Q4J988_SULAC|nr:hypothetical protein [Sulfolobus acidocaldarius]AAY80641.1 hypothetical protein Saci_1302 [Sulfolobus acidocaldarius DSM 639]AGE73506.1 hypothetical protein SacRon12I_06350 [Sulfolobus acidocaldarius Ron12/I]ALU30495.1 hypothetical protein ATY89_11480 [Sulfolobus acidocaldarius]ALU31218.1 hypothetical protein ATZ20_03035 [Sulfolobus acidocaldarius]WCM35161.1 hypothetical protein GO597_07385 [Sulfolobus acidocaldarius DSM 639]
MKRRKKGISTILGALIFLQILVISISILIVAQNKMANATQQISNKLDFYAQSSPLTIVQNNGGYFLVSTTPGERITYVIYPDGNIKEVNIQLPSQLSTILNGSEWAVVITNMGTWFNVTNINSLDGGDLSPSSLISPLYSNMGLVVGYNPLPETYFTPSVVKSINVSTPWNERYEYGLTGTINTFYAWGFYGFYSPYSSYSLDKNATLIFPIKGNWLNITLYHNPLAYDKYHYPGYTAWYNLYTNYSDPITLYLPFYVNGTPEYVKIPWKTYTVVTTQYDTNPLFFVPYFNSPGADIRISVYPSPLVSLSNNTVKNISLMWGNSPLASWYYSYWWWYGPSLNTQTIQLFPNVPWNFTKIAINPSRDTMLQYIWWNNSWILVSNWTFATGNWILHSNGYTLPSITSLYNMNWVPGYPGYIVVTGADYIIDVSTG